MFVDRSMTKKVVTVTADTSIFEARERMASHNVRHLPVVGDNDILIGMVTDRDIRSALPRDLFLSPVTGPEREKYENMKVKDIMSSDLLTISPTDTLPDALLLIEKKKVGALPVVDAKGRLRGIISVRDLLRAFINVLGIGQPGTLVGILVEEKIGQLKKIVDAITEEGVSFGSVLVARYWDQDKRAVFPYLLTQNVSRVKKKLADMGYTLLDPMDWYIDQLPKND